MEESSAELEVKLEVYNSQLTQLKAALSIDAQNQELKNMYEQLGQVVTLTETMLNLRRQQEGRETLPKQHNPIISNKVAAAASPPTAPPSSAPSLKRKIGDKCYAKWSGDGQYYEVTIDSINIKDDGSIAYTVTFLGYGTTEEVQEEALSSNASGKDGNGKKKAVDESKRKRKVAMDEEGNIVIPKNLQINPNDSQEVRATKKKKIHAIRSAVRFQKIDEEQSQRKSEWQSFLNVKGKEKKTGYFTGRKQESIFKSPDNPSGKVGVTGSGKPMTEPITFERPKPTPLTIPTSAASSSTIKLPL